MKISLDRVEGIETKRIKEDVGQDPYWHDYHVNKRLLKSVIKEEIKTSQISNPEQFYIIHKELNKKIPKYPLLLPLYRSLYRARKIMFSRRYNGLRYEKGNQPFWRTNGHDDSHKWDTIPYQVTHNFYHAMTRNVKRKEYANFFPNDEEKSYSASWLDTFSKNYVMEEACEKKPIGQKKVIPLGKDQRSKDFILAMLYFDCTWMKTREVMKYLTNFPKIIKEKDKKAENKMRITMMKETKRKIKKWFLVKLKNNGLLKTKDLRKIKVCDKIIKQIKMKKGDELKDIDKMLETICTPGNKIGKTIPVARALLLSVKP